MVGPDLSGLPPAAQAAFAALQRQFCAGLAERWVAIAEAPTPQAQTQALHKLAGAAGSYGMGALSQAARTAEHLAPQGPSAELSAALNQLHTLVDAARAGA